MKSFFKILVGARGSRLSQLQVEEVHFELLRFTTGVGFQPIWVNTRGDKDLKTSLRFLDRTDFFTREIDQMQLKGLCRIGIHSAKDLPASLRKGLTLVALTKGLDPSDSLVFREGESLETLQKGARIATSSLRREKNLLSLRPDLDCVDIRGNIEDRLAKLDEKQIDGVVVAECALIRLGLIHRSRITLPGEVAALQGQLAVIARLEDKEMIELFQCIDTREKLSI